MAEVVGILASAAQLSEYTIKLASALAEAFKVIKYGPKTLNARSRQLSRLLETTDVIERNEKLHTPLIHSHLRVIIAEAHSLRQTLDRVVLSCNTGSIYTRYFRALGSGEDKTLLQAFDSLEKEKASLILSISIASADALLRLDRPAERFVKMASKDVAYKPDNNKQTESSPRIEQEGGAMIISTNVEGGDGAESSRSKKEKTSRQASAPVARTTIEHTGNDYTNLRVVNNSGMFNGDADGNSRNHKYNNIGVSYNSFVHNGNMGSAATPGRHERTHIGNMGSPATPGRHEYGDLFASDGSTMVNGNAPVEGLDEISNFMKGHRTRMAFIPKES
ncbi:hypothetical protein BP6252_11477 [Coleophoma cylindrospora]|uniref:Uncharacterized protein n=1 Tax=Coleophoma cylindrospora TaxID=1849047 RepID=A0A3D8QKS7_9HELO|nr:hypothetical protein BP6252_11477 [Coleophoma cylindrospora]